MTKNKIYDIYFMLNSYSIFSIIAKNKKEAKQKAEEELINMSKNEILERLITTIEIEPNFKITNCEYVEDWED